MLKTVAEVRSLIQKARSLTSEIADFRSTQILSKDGMSVGAKNLVTFFKGILEEVDWDSANHGMAENVRRRFKETAKVAACHAMLNRLACGERRLLMESTTAGVDLPTFTRQLLITITRAYAQLFALQLFGVLPLNQPTGRLHFKDYLYDSWFNGSVANPTPTIAQGDRTDDITKFNQDFYAANEGAPANKTKFKYSSLDISVSSKRVVAEWTDELADDAMSVFDDDAERTLMDHMSQEMSRVVDRDLIGAVLASVPSANTYTWTATPDGTAGSINYATSSASDRRVYDETLFSDGIQTVINKIRTTRRFNSDGDPNWLICDPTFSLRLMKSQAFRPVDRLKEFDIKTGALRDLGELTALNLRCLIDPMLTANTAVLGRRPVSKNDPAIYWAPYISLQPTRDLYDPETGTTMKGVRNRYAIAKPNTGVNAASSQLADVYGKLTVV